MAIPNLVEYNLTKCTISPDKTDFAYGEEVHWVITADNNCVIDTCNGTYLDDYGRTRPLTINIDDTRKTATIDFTFLPYDETEVTINATAIDSAPPKPVVSPVTYNLTKCTISPNNTEFEINKSVHWVITANDNCVIDTCNAKYEDDYGKNIFIDCVIDEQRKTATIDFTFPSYETIAEINCVCETIVPPPVEKYGSINVYRLNESDLNSFAKKRFIEGRETPDGVVFKEIDLANYVHSIQRVYAPIPVGQPTTIKCGNYDTEISVTDITDDKITLDFGTIDIPYINNDTNDFNAKLDLFLPFKGFVNLSDFYMGKSLKVTYTIDVVSGDAVIILSVDGITTQMFEVKVSQPIIYRTDINNITQHDSGDFNTASLLGFHAFLNVYYTDSIKDTEPHVNSRVTALNTLTGYYEVVEVVISTANMLQQDEEEVRQLLKDGVYL